VAGIKRDNLFLLPKRHGSPSSEDEFGRKKIRQWVDDLPIGDVGSLSNDLHGKLERLNRLQLPPLERFEILELLQTPLRFVLDTLRRSCSEGDMPLDIKSRLAAEMRLELMVNTVIGYKIVLSQFHDDSITGFLLHRNTRSEALRGALSYLGEILLHSYLLYQPGLSYAWKELHGIYHYSVANELHVNRSGGLGRRKPGQQSIEELYKQILLLALANPNSLLKGEVEKVNTTLMQWSAATELVSIKEPVWARSFFLIDAQVDTMPCAPNLCQKEKIDIGWALITDDLDRLLDQKIKAAESAHVYSAKMRPADAVSERLLRKLRAAWTQQIRSREVRSHTSGLVEVVCGLEPLYRLHGGDTLSGGTGRGAGSRSFSTRPGYARVGSVALQRDEVVIDVEPSVLKEHGVKNGKAVKPKVHAEPVYRKECISTNKSENGYYLNWPDSGVGGTHVGELVGVNPVTEKEGGADLSLGVIRWMHVERPGFLGMGVELLNGLIEPVLLQRKRRGASRAEGIKGFLQHDGEGSVTLITPPFFVDEDDVFRVVKKGERQLVELRQIIESTDSFVRFQFEQAA
jgi:cyclic-di-GMP-binding protein